MSFSDSSLSIDLAALDSTQEKKLLAERIRLAFGNNPAIFAAGFALAVWMAVFLWPYNPPQEILTWLSAVFALYAARYYASYRFHRANPTDERTPGWLWLLYAGNLLGGAAWGAGFFVLFPSQSYPLQLFLVIALVGLSLTSAMAFSPLVALTMAFSAPAALLLTARFITGGLENGMPVGLSLLTGLAAFFIVLRRLEASVVNSLKLKFENSHLIARLEVANQRLKTLSDSAFEGMLIHCDGAVLDVNKTLLKTFGYASREDLIGRKVFDLIAEESRALAAEKIGFGSTEMYEMNVLDARGNHIPVEVQGKPMPYHGKMARVVAVRNLSERVLAQKRLLNANHFLQTVIDAIPAPVFYKDARGIYTGCNKAFEEFLGKSREDIIGKGVFDLSPKELAEKYYQMDQDLFLQGGTQVYESQVARPDGARKVIFNKACFYEPGGALGGLVGVILDITELKNAQSGLMEAKNRAEEAAAVRDKFVSLVSHDLRSPISTISNIATLVAKSGAGAMESQHVQLLDRVTGICANMINMIDNLLSITSIGAGFLKPEKRSVHAHWLAAEIMEALSPAAQIKGVILKNSIPPQSRIWADPALLGEALRNLLTNAIKFSHSGGEVTVSADEDSSTQSLIVRDGGVGVAPQMAANLFRHDVKTTSAGTAGERGSGFGLPLSMDIMRAHGGTITFQSRAGMGASFALELPRSGESRAAALETAG